MGPRFWYNTCALLFGIAFIIFILNYWLAKAEQSLLKESQRSYINTDIVNTKTTLPDMAADSKLIFYTEVNDYILTTQELTSSNLIETLIYTKEDPSNLLVKSYLPLNYISDAIAHHQTLITRMLIPSPNN